MRKTRLFWQLYPSYLIIALLPLIAVIWYASGALQQFYHDQTLSELQARALLLEEEIRMLLVAEQFDRVDAICKELGGKTSTRVTVVLPDGKVVGDTRQSPAGMENHADRPEIIGALAGQIRAAVRYSETLKKNLMYVAVPVRQDDRTIGAVRTSLSAAFSLRQFYLDRTVSDLQTRARLVEDEMLQVWQDEGPQGVDRLCKKLGSNAATRVTVILPDGKVIGDSEESPEKMDNHSDRREMIDARAGGTGRALRHSHTLSQDMMYVAIPVKVEQQVAFILRMSIPATTIDRAVSSIRRNILAGAVVVLLLVAGVSLIVSRRISRPLEQLKLGAGRFAAGDLDHKLPVARSQEIGALAETLNQMATELDDRIRAVVRQRNEREAILSSMVEGVLAVDLRQRLISLNEAGAKLLGVDARTAHGRTLQEVVRNEPLQKLVAAVLASREPMEEEIVFFDNENRFLQAYGTVLGDASGQLFGVLLVLHDVTRIRRLESVRHDFVANVSHELKTPVTSIKGFVETLLDGAMHSPEDTERFLQIVAGQTDRLSAIIDDLLDLSRIEKEAGRAEIALAQGPIKNVLEAACELCRNKASQKEIEFELTCDDALQAAINPPLLEQAVVNLIDNAIKYSPAGKPIHLVAARNEAEIVICVRDHGCGIPAEHLPRLFERFYRVDKARSRKLGGTGLGLAIVKHIAQAHGGRASVDSTPNQGSTFAIHLPCARTPVDA